jgi:hypothetical protein
MSLATRLVRVITGAAVVGSVALIGHANAAAPLTTKLFLRQEGCGTTQESGRLETKAGPDGSDGCGTIGGVPLNEIDHTADLGLFAVPNEFVTNKKSGLPAKLDTARKVTGVVAATVYWGDLPGGVGKVSFDLALIGRSVSGKTIDFGTQTVTADASATSAITSVPFTFAMPSSAKGQTLSKLTFSVVQRGANFNQQARSLNGTSYLVIPTKK